MSSCKCETVKLYDGEHRCMRCYDPFEKSKKQISLEGAPRGIRLHNPGNIRASGIDWEGETDPGDERAFTVFKNPWWGIRAMARILMRYHGTYQLKTVAEIIDRYAPDHENPTSKYAAFVAKGMGIPVDEWIEMNYQNLEAMVKAMIHFENGLNPYTWEITTGLILAGMEPET